MLDDIKIVIDILKELFGLQQKDNERIYQLLKQMSDELIDMANIWQVILQELEKDPDRPPRADVYEYVISQRGHFQALVRFSEAMSQNKHLCSRRSKISQTILETIEASLYIKGNLYTLIHNVVYPDQPMLESTIKVIVPPFTSQEMTEIKNRNSNDPTLSEDERIKLKFLKKDVAHWEAMVDRKDTLRKGALLEFRKHVSDLTALAGDFRTKVALFRAGI